MQGSFATCETNLSVIWVVGNYNFTSYLKSWPCVPPNDIKQFPASRRAVISQSGCCDRQFSPQHQHGGFQQEGDSPTTIPVWQLPESLSRRQPSASCHLSNLYKFISCLPGSTCSPGQSQHDPGPGILAYTPQTKHPPPQTPSIPTLVSVPIHLTLPPPFQSMAYLTQDIFIDIFMEWFTTALTNCLPPSKPSAYICWLRVRDSPRSAVQSYGSSKQAGNWG